MKIIKEFTSPYERSFLCRLTDEEINFLSSHKRYINCKRFILINGLSEFEVKQLFSFAKTDFGCEPCFEVNPFNTFLEAELYAQLRSYRKALKQLNTNFKFITIDIEEDIDTSSDRNKKEEEK